MPSLMRRAPTAEAGRALLPLLMVAMAGCNKTNDLYCVGHPSDPFCIDASVGCSSSAQCMPPSPVCKLPEMSCVQCTPSEASACTGSTPVCSSTNSCRGCQTDDECASQACDVQSGACVAESSVLYVAPAGTGPACTHAAPCGLVMTAVGLLDTTHAAIKMLAGSYTERVSIADKTVTVHGAGADLTEAMQGEILHVEGAANVSVLGLRIHDALGGAGDGIRCVDAGGNTPILTLTAAKLDTNGGIGINATRCQLTATRSTIAKNTGGGIAVGNGSTFVIVGNVFFGNGSGPAATTTGGVSITTTQSATNRLEFNTFNSNQSQTGIGTAIHCFAGAFTARNNIMSENGTLANKEQVGGSCLHAYSIAEPGTLPGGGTNLAGDPMFVDTVTGNLHIQPGSAAIRAAAPDSDLGGIAAQDIDGDARVAPADIGADEIPR